MKTIGLGAIFIGIITRPLSAFGAYTFPNTSFSGTADLTTQLTLGWQRMVITISLAIIAMIGLLTGAMLYGFGRTIEEINHLQPIRGEPKKKE